jgi:restriction endonuclease S subunit
MALTDHSALALYPAGTLLVAMYGATVGRAGILAVGATVNQACCALQSRGILSPKYAFYWLLAHRSEIMTLASGGGQPNISQDVVRGLRIPAPPWDEQLELAAALDESAEQADLARASLTGSVELLNEYKQSLITAAVTGEFDVTTAASGIPG